MLKSVDFKDTTKERRIRMLSPPKDGGMKRANGGVVVGDGSEEMIQKKTKQKRRRKRNSRLHVKDVIVDSASPYLPISGLLFPPFLLQSNCL